MGARAAAGLCWFACTALHSPARISLPKIHVPRREREAAELRSRTCPWLGEGGHPGGHVKDEVAPQKTAEVLTPEEAAQ